MFEPTSEPTSAAGQAAITGALNEGDLIASTMLIEINNGHRRKTVRIRFQVWSMVIFDQLHALLAQGPEVQTAEEQQP